MLASLHQVKSSDRPISYQPFIKLYDFTDFWGTVDLNQIKSFEKKNNISVNVYTTSNKDVLPIQISSEKREKHVNLLLQDEHYFCIRNFHRLASSKKSWQRFFCYNCISGFRNKIQLTNHEQFCNKPQKLILPAEKTYLKYQSYHKEIKFPCVVYADFETLASPAAMKNAYQEHTACSFGFIAVDWSGNIILKKFYRGEQAAEIFLSSLIAAKEKIEEHINASKKPLIMTKDDELKFLTAKDCWLCKKPLDEDAVRDHDHLSGKFRGAAHLKCNFLYALPTKIPIIFHNLKNFDSHIIITALKPNLFKKISIIPQNLEKFIAFSADSFIFLDSFAFLPSSLDMLSSNLSEEDKEHLALQLFEKEDLPFISNKGTLPYGYAKQLSII